MFEKFQRGDVIVADYHLDGRNTGLELLTRLRQRLDYDVPGVVLSGDLPSVLRSAAHAGAELSVSEQAGRYLGAARRDRRALRWRRCRSSQRCGRRLKAQRA